MHHDAFPLTPEAPASGSSKDIAIAYRSWFFRAASAFEELIATDSRYRSNLSGHLAWDSASYLRSLLVLYRVDRDDSLLDKFEACALEILDARDTERANAHTSAPARPVWSAGARYNLSRAQLCGTPENGIHILASGSAVVISEDDGGFTLSLEDSEGCTTVLESASWEPGSPNYFRYGLEARPNPPLVIDTRSNPYELMPVVGRYPLKEQRAPHLVHTALITRPLLEYAWLCTKDSGRRGALARHFAISGLDAMTAHQDEFVQSDSLGLTSGFYTVPVGFPARHQGLPLPHNQVADAAACHAILSTRLGGVVTDDQAVYHRRVAEALMAPTLSELQGAGATCAPWNYYPVGTPTYEGTVRDTPAYERVIRPAPKSEDSSHALMRVQPFATVHGLFPGMVRPEHVRRAAQTLFSGYLEPGLQDATSVWSWGSSDTFRVGYADRWIGGFMPLALYDDKLYDAVLNVAFHHPPDEVFGATLYSAAELAALYARQELEPDSASSD